MHRYNRDIIWTVLTSTFIIYLISYIWSCASQAKTKQNKNNRHQTHNPTISKLKNNRTIRPIRSNRLDLFEIIVPKKLVKTIFFKIIIGTSK